VQVPQQRRLADTEASAQSEDPALPSLDAEHQLGQATKVNGASGNALVAFAAPAQQLVVRSALRLLSPPVPTLGIVVGPGATAPRGQP
jgi:hypothetical protein